MATATSNLNSHIRLTYIPRRLLNREEKSKPNENLEQLNPTEPNTTATLENHSTIPLTEPATNLQAKRYQSKLHNIEIKTKPMRTNEISTSTNNTSFRPVNHNFNSFAQLEQVHRNSNGCFQRLSSTQKNVLKVIIGILIIVGVVSAAVLPPVFLFVIAKTDAPTTIASTTVWPCSSTTCIGQETPYRTSAVIALYKFDGNTTDSTGRLTGISYNSPTYVNQAYSGTQSLSLNNPGANQYVEIPYVDLISGSFTIQLWVYLASNIIQNDYGIFSQCDLNSTCLSIHLRNGRFVLSFDSMNVTNNTLFSITIVSSREWTHLAVVYDMSIYQQQIYVNGRLDAISSGMVPPFKRNSVNSTTFVGRARSSAYGSTYFTGRIDHLTISTGIARTECQISNDGSLMAYFPFNTVDPFNDYSVSLFDGTASDTSFISEGRSGQAIYFPFNSSYFQTQCFAAIRNVTNSNPPFTFSLWVNAAAPISGGSIVHISSLPFGNGSICYDLLALSSTGALVAQLLQTALPVIGLQGPILPANTWTHVAVMYSQDDGLRLFVDSQLVGLSAATVINLTRWDIPLYVTLGNSNSRGLTSGLNCPSSSLSYVSGSFTGAIDDFRLYNRELDFQEVCALANS